MSEWMPFVIFCARSRDRLQLPLLGQFLRGFHSRCGGWNLELWSSTNATSVAYARITEERWWRMGKSVFASFFSVWRKHDCMGKVCILASYSISNKFLLDTLWLWAFKNAFKAGTVNFSYSLSPPSIVKKVHTGSKNANGLERYQVKVKGVNDPTRTTQ